jgi:uncharacterized alkaline shock family protein YloU
MTNLAHPFHVGPLRGHSSRTIGGVPGAAEASGDRPDVGLSVGPVTDADTGPARDTATELAAEPEVGADPEAGSTGLTDLSSGESTGERSAGTGTRAVDPDPVVAGGGDPGPGGPRADQAAHPDPGMSDSGPAASDSPDPRSDSSFDTDAAGSEPDPAVPDLADSRAGTEPDRVEASDIDEGIRAGAGPGISGLIRLRGRKVTARRAGETTIADEVIEKVAGIAARKVAGVHDLRGRGVSAQLTGRHAKLSVALTVEYGHPLYDVADRVRESLADTVERILGIDITHVDVAVEDVHLPEESV